MAFKTRRVNTRKVSNMGPISIAKANAGPEFTDGVLVAVNLFSSIKRIAIIADISPIIKEPESPINILAGVRL